jgi:hypothetical protein
MPCCLNKITDNKERGRMTFSHQLTVTKAKPQNVLDCY